MQKIDGGRVRRVRVRISLQYVETPLIMKVMLLYKCLDRRWVNGGSFHKPYYFLSLTIFLKVTEESQLTSNTCIFIENSGQIACVIIVKYETE